MLKPLNITGNPEQKMKNNIILDYSLQQEKIKSINH